MISKRILSVLLVIVAAAATVSGFVPQGAIGGVSGGSGFVVSQRQRQAPIVESPRSGSSSLYMGGKKSKFGVFSPAVYVAKIALGEKKLNSLRGKGISLHSQAIGDFCKWSGAYHLRTKLIKLAKTNGDTLGFLV